MPSDRTTGKNLRALLLFALLDWLLACGRSSIARQKTTRPGANSAPERTLHGAARPPSPDRVPVSDFRSHHGSQLISEARRLEIGLRQHNRVLAAVVWASWFRLNLYFRLLAPHAFCFLELERWALEPPWK